MEARGARNIGYNVQLGIARTRVRSQQVEPVSWARDSASKQCSQLAPSGEPDRGIFSRVLSVAICRATETASSSSALEYA